MQIWGLTGGIASGKTTVGNMFAALGLPVVGADKTYHALIQPQQGRPSPLVQKIGQAFANVLHADGSLNRKALGNLVFHDAQARQILDNLTHPAVAEATQKQFATLQHQGATQALYDVPLLYEKNLQKNFSGVIVVWVPKNMQEQRLMLRDKLTAPEALARLAAQMPLDLKKQQADWVIDNSQNLQHTQAQVHQLWGILQNMPQRSN